MKPSDVHLLVEWLGREGAVAGLERSSLTNAELMVLARETGLTVNHKATRRQLAIELVMSPVRRIDKPMEYLLKMSPTELRRYFADRMVSNAELASLLKDLGIAPTGNLRGKLPEYAAREISELGVFQRVAKGNVQHS